MIYAKRLVNNIRPTFLLSQSFCTMHRNLTIFCTIFVLCFTINHVSTARILAVVTTPSFSHQNAYRQLWEELSLRGHEVVLLTTDPVTNASLTNLTQIDLHGAYNAVGRMPMMKSFILFDSFKPVAYMEKLIAFVEVGTEYELRHPQVRALIEDKEEHFDLVIGEYLYSHVIAYSTRFKCPFIGILTLDAHYATQDIMSNPTHPVLFPHYDLGFIHGDSFFQRLKSTVFSVVHRYYFYNVLYPKTDATVRKYFGMHRFKMVEERKKMALLFINVSPVFLYTRPVVPGMINVGGTIHAAEPKELEKV